MSLGLTHKRRTMKNHEVQFQVNLTMRDETKEKSTKKSNTKQISIKIMRMRFDIKKVGHLVILERICVEKRTRERTERGEGKRKRETHTPPTCTRTASPIRAHRDESTLQEKVAFHHHMTLHVLLECDDIFYKLARAM